MPKMKLMFKPMELFHLRIFTGEDEEMREQLCDLNEEKFKPLDEAQKFLGKLIIQATYAYELQDEVKHWQQVAHKKQQRIDRLKFELLEVNK